MAVRAWLNPLFMPVLADQFTTSLIEQRESWTGNDDADYELAIILKNLLTEAAQENGNT